ncbi:MAG: hypothetical protein H7240_06435 [Glaciimonas sp.]|nr:hypothetical protein [Glaciimonas sp.]
MIVLIDGTVVFARGKAALQEGADDLRMALEADACLILAGRAYEFVPY